MNEEHLERPTDADLERYKKNAMTRRRLAWELLKQTRNPTYVALRYGYPVETMQKALEKIPDDSGRPVTRSAPADAIHSSIKRARELIPETCRTREPGEDDDLE